MGVGYSLCPSRVVLGRSRNYPHTWDGDGQTSGSSIVSVRMRGLQDERDSHTQYSTSGHDTYIVTNILIAWSEKGEAVSPSSCGCAARCCVECRSVSISTWLCSPPGPDGTVSLSPLSLFFSLEGEPVAPAARSRVCRSGRCSMSICLVCSGFTVSNVVYCILCIQLFGGIIRWRKGYR